LHKDEAQKDDGQDAAESRAGQGQAISLDDRAEDHRADHGDAHPEGKLDDMRNQREEERAASKKKRVNEGRVTSGVRAGRESRADQRAMTGILGESGAKVDGWGMGSRKTALRCPAKAA